MIPAHRREARDLWRLHHQLGYSFRRYLGQSRSFEKDVRTIARTATTSVLNVINMNHSGGHQHRHHVDSPRVHQAAHQVSKAVPEARQREVDQPSALQQEQIVEVPQVKTVEQFVEMPQVQPCASPAVASTTPQVITPDPSDECSRARGGAWVHRAHTSEESTCVGEETSTGDDDEASAGGSEDWVVRPRWRHNRRPRRDRRRKARIRRDEYLAAQQAAFLEAQHEGGAGAQTLSVLGALLEGIAEDEGDWAGGGRDGYAPSSASTEEDGGVRETTAPTHAAPVGASIAPQVLGKGGILPRAKMAAAAPIEDIDPIQEPASKKARTDEALDVLNAAGQESSSSDSDATSEGEGGSGASSRLEEVDGDGLLEHELLEGLDKGVESLPASLVWTMVHIQEAADRWQVVDDPTGPRSALPGRH